MCIRKFLKKHEILFLILLIYLFFHLFLINGFFPITEGWFQDYARYIMQGEVPYRDFYVPIPPGFLFLIKLLRSIFGDIFLYYRIYGIIERCILVTIVYFIFRRLYPDNSLFIALLTGSVIYTANVQDIFYGYHQSSFFVSVIVLYVIIRMHEEFNGNRVYLWSMAFGILSVCAFIFKQTIGGLLPITLLCVFTLLNFKKDKRKTIYCDLISVAFALLLLLLIGIMLSLHNAFIPCIKQIFIGAQSKGDFINIFIGFIPRMIKNLNTNVIVFFSFLFLLYVIIQQNNSIKIKKLCSFLITMVEVAVLYESFFKYFVLLRLESRISLIMVLVYTLVILFSSYIYVKSNKDFNFFVIMTSLFLLGFFLISSYRIDSFMSFSMYVRNTRQSLIYCMFFINIIWIIIKLFQLFDSGLVYSEAVKLFILSASFSIMYAHGLSHIIEDHGTLLIVVFLVCQFLSVKKTSYFNFSYVIKTGIVAYCLLTVFCIFSQKLSIPYIWWGVNALPPVIESKYKYEDPNLKGILGNKDSVQKMNEIYELIEKNKKNNDTMFTFPHINYFNVMSGLNSPTFSKVHYFDVCPDFVIERDLKILKEAPPEFVVIQNFDKDVWDFHENVFRNGKQSFQRKIIEFYRLEVKSKRYKLLKHFKIAASNGIFVLRKNY